MGGGSGQEQVRRHPRSSDPEELNFDVAEADGIRCHDEDEEDVEETERDPKEDVRHRVNYACDGPFIQPSGTLRDHVTEMSIDACMPTVRVSSANFRNLASWTALPPRRFRSQIDRLTPRLFQQQVQLHKLYGTPSQTFSVAS